MVQYTVHIMVDAEHVVCGQVRSVCVCVCVCVCARARVCVCVEKMRVPSSVVRLIQSCIPTRRAGLYTLT